MRTLAPVDEEDVTEAIAAALIAQSPLEIIGAASRRALGRPVEASAFLTVRSLSGVVFYEPAELVLCARAGTPCAEIVDLLESHGQALAFEPIDHGRFYGGEARSGTIGGMIATNASGPRRIKAGAARDHLLGFRGVTGRGDLIKSGGRVMKNVTGYDLPKLAAGSYGTLVVLTEVTLKALPKAEIERTLFVFDEEARGLALLREASGLPLDISGLALEPGTRGSAPRAAFRFEGPALSVDARCEDFLQRLRERGAKVDSVADKESRDFWADLRDGGPTRTADGQVWRVSAAPKNGGAVVETIKLAGAPIMAYVYDWAGGLVWLALESAPDAHAGLVRGAVDRFGGHATLLRAEEATRASVPVFHPQPPALAALTKRVKESFDPLRLLNRGRLRPDM